MVGGVVQRYLGRMESQKLGNSSFQTNKQCVCVCVDLAFSQEQWLTERRNLETVGCRSTHFRQEADGSPTSENMGRNPRLVQQAQHGRQRPFFP